VGLVETRLLKNAKKGATSKKTLPQIGILARFTLWAIILSVIRAEYVRKKGKTAFFIINHCCNWEDKAPTNY
jgi:hypothetical protein